MKVRKSVFYIERILGEMGATSAIPVTRVVGVAIVTNPYANQFVEDLSEFYQEGHDLAVELMETILPLLDAPVTSYGKLAVVGVNGELEHGHAMLHPMLGKAMRNPIGGGKAIIPSNAKVAAAGATADIPLGHKDDLWSFDHFDAITVSIPDAPRPNEIMLAIAIADGGRPLARCGNGRIAN